jgi:hypothetical protein
MTTMIVSPGSLYPPPIAEAAEISQGSARPVLVAGGPRTGTSWVIRALHQAAEGVAVIYEPDNEWPNPFALKAKLPLGRFPVLEDGDVAPRAYEQLWQRALAGRWQGKIRESVAWKFDQGERTMRELWRAMCEPREPQLSLRLRVLTRLARPPSTRQKGNVVLVKSVHAPLALEWIAARFRPRIVAVVRHPLNVIAGWMALGWGGCALEQNPRVRERFGRRWKLPELGPGSSALQRVSWEVGLITTVLHAGIERHPDWVVASHESLCLDPETGFRRLYEQLDLTWSRLVDRYLTESNRPGTGYEVLRVASDQPESWKRRLTRDQVATSWSVLSRFEAPWVERMAAELA